MLTRDFPPAYGGISTGAQKLVSKLKGLGVEIDVFCGRTDWNTLTLPLRTSFGGYDLVHVQSPAYGAFVRGRPLVVTVHSPIPTEFPYYPPGLRMTSVPGFALERMTLLRAKRIIAVSESTREELSRRERIDPMRTIVIPNGVDLTLLSGERSWPGSGPLRILVVSRLEPRKGVETVLRALARVPTASYELEVVGRGSERSKLETVSKELGINVMFRGELPEPELARCYLDSDVVVAAGQSEGFGLTLLEGAAAGAAVLASDIPSHRAILADGGGLTFSNAGDLRRRLTELAEDRRFLRQMGEQARRVAAHRTWDSAARQVKLVYESALGKAS